MKHTSDVFIDLKNDPVKVETEGKRANVRLHILYMETSAKLHHVFQSPAKIRHWTLSLTALA